jgi:hypothetical protein
VKFEFGRGSNSNYVSNPRPNNSVLIGKGSQAHWAEFNSPCDAAAQPKVSFGPLTHAAPLSPSLSLPRGSHSSAPPLIPFFSFLPDPCAGQTEPPRCAAGLARPARGTGRGRAARLARTPRAGARGTGGGRGKGEGQLCPARGHPRRLGLQPWRATCPARRRCQGHGGPFPLEAPRRGFKRGGGSGGWRQG